MCSFLHEWNGIVFSHETYQDENFLKFNFLWDVFIAILIIFCLLPWFLWKIVKFISAPNDSQQYFFNNFVKIKKKLLRSFFASVSANWGWKLNLNFIVHGECQRIRPRLKASFLYLSHSFFLFSRRSYMLSEEDT